MSRMPIVKHHGCFMRSILIVSVLAVVSCGQKIDFPSVLIGRWATEAERYEDRYIEISNEMITFGTGTGVPNMYFINEIDQKQNIPIAEYTFQCTNTEGTEFSFIFCLQNTGDRMELRLNNPRQIVWVKIPKSNASVIPIVEKV